MKKSTQLRQLLAKKQLIVAPGCFDALTVLLAQKAGFSAAYLSGFGVSAGLLGMPDMGFTTMTEIHAVARYAANAVDIPVIGSLNGVSPGGWMEYAKKIEAAGADALELNIYYIATDIRSLLNEVHLSP